jgi:flagellar hook-basal body complex protein FliE
MSTDPFTIADLSNLQRAGRAPGAPGATPPTPSSAPQGKSFADVIIESLNEVNRLQNEADQGVQKLLTGETNNVAEVLAASNKAGIAFDLLMEVRNKLVDAYQEIQQMRV